MIRTLLELELEHSERCLAEGGNTPFFMLFYHFTATFAYCLINIFSPSHIISILSSLSSNRVLTYQAVGSNRSDDHLDYKIAIYQQYPEVY